MRYAVVLASLAVSAMANNYCPAPVVVTETVIVGPPATAPPPESTAPPGTAPPPESTSPPSSTVSEISATATSTIESAFPSASAPPTGEYFGVVAARSASPIHLLRLTARNGKFYLGGPPPSSYCPAGLPEGSCPPPSNDTAFVGGDGTLGLAVLLPGGQNVYVAADFTLSYTIPHGNGAGDGSVTNQFSKLPPSDNSAFGELKFEDGFFACPTGDKGWQVFGKIRDASHNTPVECLTFRAMTVNGTGPTAWQY